MLGSYKTFNFGLLGGILLKGHSTSGKDNILLQLLRSNDEHGKMENCLVIQQARSFCVMMRISTCVVSFCCVDCHIVIILPVPVE